MTRESFYRDLGVYSVRGLFMSSVVTSVDFFFFFFGPLGNRSWNQPESEKAWTTSATALLLSLGLVTLQDKFLVKSSNLSPFHSNFPFSFPGSMRLILRITKKVRMLRHPKGP